MLQKSGAADYAATWAEIPFTRVFSDNAGSASTKTWTVPAGVYAVRFRLFGPGANGVAGQTTGPRSGGGGGGAGAMAEGMLLVSPGDVISYLIPLNNTGTAAWFVASSGANQISAPAGAQGNAAGAPGAGGAAPTIGANHTARVVGFPGRAGRTGHAATVSVVVGVTTDYGGDGGDTLYGNGGRGGKDANGTAASGYGAGGGGCPNGNTPGAGASAGLILTY